MEEENEQKDEVEEEPHTEARERKEDQKAQVTGAISPAKLLNVKSLNY